MIELIFILSAKLISKSVKDFQILRQFRRMCNCECDQQKNEWPLITINCGLLPILLFYIILWFGFILLCLNFFGCIRRVLFCRARIIRTVILCVEACYTHTHTEISECKTIVCRQKEKRKLRRKKNLERQRNQQRHGTTQPIKIHKWFRTTARSFTHIQHTYWFEISERASAERECVVGSRKQQRHVHMQADTLTLAPRVTMIRYQHTTHVHIHHNPCMHHEGDYSILL